MDGADNVEIPQIDPEDYIEYAEYIFHSDGDIYDGDGNYVDNAAGSAWNGWVFTGDKWNTDDDTNVQAGFLYFEGEFGNVLIDDEVGSDGNPWEITILAEGYIDISGNPWMIDYANPDNPEFVQALLLVSGTDIKVSGNPSQEFAGIIYATEQIDISGNPEIEGALIAADLSNDDDYIVANSISGNMDLSYSGELQFPDTTGEDHGKVFALSWRDLEIARNTDVFAAIAEIEPIDPQGY